MTQSTAIRCHYWSEGRLIQNLGDALTPLILQKLGYSSVNCQCNPLAVVNPDGCLLITGSLLSPINLETILVSFTGTLDVWGCGWRGQPIPSELHRRIRFHAVRGPQTVTGLALASDIPIGDPALLCPYLWPAKVSCHGRNMVVPHWNRVYQMSARQRCYNTECNELLSVRVVGCKAPMNPSVLRPLLGAAKHWCVQGIPVWSITKTIERIGGANFVLTGSLHAAILAQAYGVPWAAYDDGYINAPAKWQDWAAYLGVELSFVRNLTEGRRWWDKQGQFGCIRSLAPLLRSFPYPNSTIDHLLQSNHLNGEQKQS